MWKVSHKYPIHHFGSSGAMESYGTIEIYNRVIDFHKLCYTRYVGDSDSRSYARVVEPAPYGDIEIKQMGCVGHIQNRMGTKLRNLRKHQRVQKCQMGKQLLAKEDSQNRLSTECKTIMVLRSGRTLITCMQ